MDEYYVGQIIMTSFGFTPKGFLPCNGQLLPIVRYQALFALLGTRYGGDGRITFALPDLRGRTPVGAGVSNDSTWQPLPYATGTLGGAEAVALTENQLPTHTHDISASKDVVGDLRTPVGNVLATSPSGNFYHAGDTNRVQLAANAVANRGSRTGHENMQPFQVISFCIAIDGIFPSRT